MSKFIYVCLLPYLQDWKNSSVYAVFDGHGGVDASYYSVAQILNHLISQSGKDKSQALSEAITKIDQGFSRKAAREVNVTIM